MNVYLMNSFRGTDYLHKLRNVCISFFCVCMLLKLSFFLCLPVNALNAELDSVRRKLNEKADEINRLSHEREKHRNGLENIVHEIKSKYCAVCKVWGSTPLLSAAGAMSH